MSTTRDDHRATPRPAEPRNRPLRAQSYQLPPQATLHRHDPKHFARQARLDLLLTVLLIGAVAYGAYRVLFH